MQKKRVSFGEISVSNLDLSDQDDSENPLWYDKNDLKAIRIDIDEELKKGDDEVECKRGLEQFDDSFNSRTRRKQHVLSVLALQDEHRENDLVDSKGLASLASALTKDCQKQARRRASVDSIDAFRLHSEHLAHLLEGIDEKEYSKQTKTTSLVSRRRRSAGKLGRNSPASGEPLRRVATTQSSTPYNSAA